MKKIFAVVAAVLLSTAVFGQVLESSGVKNTLSTGFGRTYGEVGDEKRENVHFYGLLDTLQVRFDVGKFTVEGMLNWGAFNDWGNNGYFTFANTERTPFWYTNHFDQGGWWTNGNTESYYVNFLFHPFEGFDLGMGTRLNWKVGPAPSSLGNYWEPKAHVVQGGLKDAVPGGADVAGFTYYANRYTSHYGTNTNAALGVRYHYEDLFEIGVALPSGVNSDKPLFNAGFGINLFDFLGLYAAYDGILQSNGNLYTGASVYLKNFQIDAYVAANFRTNEYYSYGKKATANHWGTGAGVTMIFPSINLTIRPEFGLTFYTFDEYTFAWYVGGRVDFNLVDDMFNFGLWTSYANGAKDKRWENWEWSKNYIGGHVFDIRPDITWRINDRHSLSAFYDYQNRRNYKDVKHDVWASGVYWTYRY